MFCKKRWYVYSQNRRLVDKGVANNRSCDKTGKKAKGMQLMIVKSKAAKRTAVLLMVGSASLGAQASDEDVTDGSMELSLESLLTLSVTTATKTGAPLSEAPSIVSVITRSEIRNSGANTLFQLLETVPGFTPIRQKTSERLMVVCGLGLKDGLLVLVDGVTVNDAFDGSFDFYERTVDDIERIEIIRGPGSALYGGYAVSGVVQIFTRHVAEDDEFGLVRAGGGSDGQASVALAGGRDLTEYVDGLRASASFSYYQTDGDEVYIERDELFEGGNSGNYFAAT